jgi:hypothetical protein
VYIPRKKKLDLLQRLNLTNPNNYRLGYKVDVLLMVAEAEEAGLSEAKARGYLNQVRRRAFKTRT